MILPLDTFLSFLYTCSICLKIFSLLTQAAWLLRPLDNESAARQQLSHTQEAVSAKMHKVIKGPLALLELMQCCNAVRVICDLQSSDSRNQADSVPQRRQGDLRPHTRSASFAKTLHSAALLAGDLQSLHSRNQADAMS